jgi:hypothetical protein
LGFKTPGLLSPLLKTGDVPLHNEFIRVVRQWHPLQAHGLMKSNCSLFPHSQPSSTFHAVIARTKEHNQQPSEWDNDVVPV